MATLSIGISDAEMKALRATLNPKQVGQALYQARVRTTRRLRVMTGDVVRSRYTIRKKFIDSPSSRDAAITAEVPKSQDAPGKVIITQKPLPLSEFQTTELGGAGVSIRIDSKRPTLTLRHGFKARVRSKSQIASGGAGHVGIFTRKKIGNAAAAWWDKQFPGIANDPARQAMLKAAGYGPGTTGLTRSSVRFSELEQYNAEGYAWRLPIEERYGPTIHQLITSSEVERPLLADGIEEFRRQVGNQISRFTDGRVKSLGALVLDTADTDN